MNLIIFLLEELKKAQDRGLGSGPDADSKSVANTGASAGRSEHLLGSVVAPLVRETLERGLRSRQLSVGDPVRSTVVRGAKGSLNGKKGTVIKTFHEYSTNWCTVKFEGLPNPFKFRETELARDEKETDGAKADSKSQNASRAAAPDPRSNPDAFVGVEVRLPASDPRAHHTRNVIKTKVGATLRVGVIGGGIGYASVRWDGAAGAGAEAAAAGGPKRKKRKQKHGGGAEQWGLIVRFGRLEPGPVMPNVHILLAHPRPKVMAKLWSILAQLGVRQIVVVNSEKVDKQYWHSDRSCVREERRFPLLAEGLQQGGHTCLPEVRVERFFKPFVQDRLDEAFPKGMVRLLCDLGEYPSIRECVTSPAAAAHGVVLAIGPEGGWTQREVDLLRSKGFRGVSIGRVIMRVDVAAISAVALAADQLSAIEKLTQGEARAGAPSAAVDKRKAQLDAEAKAVA